MESPRTTLHIVARLLRQFAPAEWRRITFGLLLVAASSAATLLQPWPLKLVVDVVLGAEDPPALLARISAALGESVALFAEPNRGLLFVLCAAVLAIEAMVGLFRVASSYVFSAAGLHMVVRMRAVLFDHLQRLSLGYHSSRPVGDSLHRVTADTASANQIFSDGIVPGVTAAATLVGITLVMLSRDVMLTLAALSVVPPLVLLIRRMDATMTERSNQWCARESEISSTVQETLTGIRAVQTFGREEHESARVRRHAHASFRASLRFNLLEAGSQAAVNLFLAAGVAVVVWTAASRVIAGRLTAGDVVLLVSYAWMLYEPLEILSFTAGNLQGAAARARRVYEVLDTLPGIVDAPRATALAAPARGRVVFEDVSFRYPGGPPVLSAVSVAIPAGARVALVGPSGAGKSTLAGMIVRFYDPTSGRITLDGHDLKSLQLSSLRRNIALVLQEPMLFDVTVGENIAYGRPAATAAQIRAAARSAGAHEFIEQLPSGYETRVGGQGQLLSLGQRQRIAIARAFLRDAPILILDEPTSSLDSVTEALVMASLRKLMRGRTTVIITHRLAAVGDVDLVIAVSDGAATVSSELPSSRATVPIPMDDLVPVAVR
ncbi:MAG TPA: ABC transporter ATP-binding protein [bacterium]